jgi:predicted nucleic acid-binding protein
MLALERASTEDQIAICDQIVLEVTQVLSERLGWETDRVAESLGIYLRDALRVPVQGSVRGVCRDPKDDRVFECALGAGARIIVSGDKDLRSVRSYLGIMVVTPRDYVTGAEK